MKFHISCSYCILTKINTNQIKVLAFEERKLDYPDNNLWKQNKEPISSTHIWHQVWELNLRHIGADIPTLMIWPGVSWFYVLPPFLPIFIRFSRFIMKF